MATTLKLRRGTTAQHASFTGALGEVTVDTDKDVVVVHDGSTAGGFPALRAGAGASVSSLTNSGNITFTGTGNRITGDFSNATFANRVMFQSSTTNGNTLIGAIPNGTGQNARIQTFASSDPTNTATLSIESNSAISQAAITSGITGTGTYLPMTFYTGGSERMRVDTSGRVGIGTVPSAWTLAANLDVGAASVVGNSTNAYFSANQYYDGAWKYKADGFGTTLLQTNGNFDFYTAPTGLANATATQTLRMRLTPGGDLGIGTSSPSSFGKLAVTASSGVIGNFESTQSATNANLLNLNATQTNSSAGIRFQINSGTTAQARIQVNGDGAIVFQQTSSDTERARIDSSGRVGINTTTTSRAILNIDTDGSNNAAGYGLALTNTAGGGATWTLQCGDQGVSNSAFTIRQTGISGTTRLKIGTDGYLTVAGVYALTTGSAANVFVDSNGTLQRSTSSLKYKKNVQDATHGLADVLKLRPVTYEGKSEADAGKTFGGFIAEEIHEAGLTEFVQYADDGSPDALAYGNMVSLLAKAIQEQQQMIETLKAKVAALEEK